MGTIRISAELLPMWALWPEWAHSLRRKCAQRCIAVDLLQVQVGHVGAEVGEAPGDVLVVADDHAGHAGEGVAGDVVGARAGDASGSAGPSGTRARASSARGAGRWRAAACRSSCTCPTPPRSWSRCRCRWGRAVRGSCRGCRRATRAGSACPGARPGRCLTAAVARPWRRAGGRTSRCALLYEPSSTMGRWRGGRVGRVQVLDLLRAEPAGHQGAVDLVLHVAAQVPGHRLEPGHRVDRRPGFAACSRW